MNWRGKAKELKGIFAHMGMGKEREILAKVDALKVFLAHIDLITDVVELNDDIAAFHQHNLTFDKRNHLCTAMSLHPGYTRARLRMTIKKSNMNKLVHVATIDIEKSGAGNGIRTHDFNLGKVTLYH